MCWFTSKYDWLMDHWCAALDSLNCAPGPNDGWKPLTFSCWLCQIPVCSCRSAATDCSYLMPIETPPRRLRWLGHHPRAAVWEDGSLTNASHRNADHFTLCSPSSLALMLTRTAHAIYAGSYSLSKFSLAAYPTYPESTGYSSWWSPTAFQLSGWHCWLHW